MVGRCTVFPVEIVPFQGLCFFCGVNPEFIRKKLQFGEWNTLPETNSELKPMKIHGTGRWNVGLLSELLVFWRVYVEFNYCTPWPFIVFGCLTLLGAAFGADFLLWQIHICFKLNPGLASLEFQRCVSAAISLLLFFVTDSIAWDENHHERENIFGSLFPSIQQANLNQWGSLFQGELWDSSPWEATIKGNIWVLPKIWENLQIIHFNRVFHYFHHPFWGFSHPYFWFDTHILGVHLFFSIRASNGSQSFFKPKDMTGPSNEFPTW